jgi:hypothetical protein
VAHDEARRIATQLTRSVRGPAWHGPSLNAALQGVTARQAVLRPIPQAHSIWEIAGHAAAWMRIVRLRIEGRGPKSVPKAINFPAPRRGTPGEWRKVLTGIRRESARLARAIRNLDDDQVPYLAAHGIVQHTTYHAGQIVLLKKAAKGARP